MIENARELKVVVDEKHVFDARRVGYDRDTDLAVLQINARGTKLKQATLGSSENLRVGQLVVAIGNPLGRQFERSVTAGVISALNREITVERENITLKLIQTDAPINPGNSGGALANSRGELIGINSLKIASTEVEGMGFAIPISDAMPIIDQLIKKGYVSRPFIGIYEFAALDPGVAEYYNLPRGIVIGDVISGSPADKAGLRPRDIILSLDGKKMLSLENLNEFLGQHQVGDQVNVEIYRDRKTLKLTLKLGERPRS